MTFGPYTAIHDSELAARLKKQDEFNKEIARFYKRKTRYDCLAELKNELNKKEYKHDHLK